MKKQPAADLQEELKKLQFRQSELIKELKKKQKPVYDWFVKKGIDFDNFHKHTANFTAAAALLISALSHKPEFKQALADNITNLDPGIENTIAKPKTDLAKAQFIWANYGQLIREAGAKYGVDPNLIFATIMIESGGNPRAIRHEPRINDASYGLGQLLYGTARGLGYRGTPEGLYDPATNINLIAVYHRHNLDRYGHLTAQQLTTAYNTGSPFKKPLAGHINKFNKWFNRVENLELDLT